MSIMHLYRPQPPYPQPPAPPVPLPNVQNPPAPAVDPLLVRNGYVWRVGVPVVIDASQQHHHNFRVNYNAAQQLRGFGIRDEFDYYMHMNAINLDVLVAATSASLAADQYIAPSLRAPVTKGEMLKYFGIRLATVLQTQRGTILDYWRVEVEPDTIFEAPRYGIKYGMSRNRFMVITQCFTLSHPQGPQMVGIYALTIILTCIYLSFAYYIA